jgi:hypothetical protein
MANSNGWGDGAANNAIGWGQGANNAIAWGDSHAKSWAGATDIVGLTTDPDAQAFITAAAITDPTQQLAIDNLVKGLKSDNIWTKMKAIYPFVGGTASTHKWNLKDPRDLDAAFRLVFNGGWTHSSTGATPNGTNGFADTKFNPNTSLTFNSAHLSFYSRTNNEFASSSTMGSNDIVNNELRIILRRPTNIGVFISTDNTNGLLTYSITNSQGLFIGNANGVNVRKFIQNSTILTPTSSALRGVSAWPAYNIFIGARNNTGTANEFDNKQTAFSSIGDGLTDTEAANLYTRVQAYQTALSRQV